MTSVLRSREGMLRVHSILLSSRANGPGVRAVVWVQGCSIGCPGCFNPETHASPGGREVAAEQLYQEVACVVEGLEGITVSGGEPLDQVDGLIAFLTLVRERTSLSIILFTGFPYHKVQALPQAAELFGLVDILLAGPFVESRRIATGLLGSSNKTAHFLTGRYGPADLAAVPKIEVQIQPDGTVVHTGVGWRAPQ